MLLDAVLKSLNCSSYVPTVTVALIVIDDETLYSKRYLWNCCTVPQVRLSSVLTTPSTGKYMEWQWVHRLTPALANIVVGYYEKLFSEISKPAVYFRYVDDTFKMKESDEFLITVNIPLFSLLSKRTTLFLSLTSTLNTGRAATKRKFIANLRSQASTYAENFLRQ